MKFTYRHKPFHIEGVSPDDLIYSSIISSGSFYEIDLLEYMFQFRNNFQKPNAVAVDVGANIGNHSIFMRSFLTDHLIAVEPNPKTLPLLENNLSRNVSNYSIFDCALGEADGRGGIVLPDGADNNLGMAKIDMQGTEKTVRITTLDSIIEDWKKSHPVNGNIAVIKIDVEGMQMAVLKGARQTLLNSRPDLFIEAATTAEFIELNNFLTEFGYKKLSRWAATPVYHYSYRPSLKLMASAKFARLLNVVGSVPRRAAGRVKRLWSHPARKQAVETH